ncbi:MAG: chromate transporter [Burkholderiales bacterium]|nr:chromate transporter [Burkholderiales bacterium]
MIALGELLGLCWHLAILSLMAIGGGLIMIAPEVHQYVVTEGRWITSEQFAAVFAIAQTAPGPNLLFISLVGWLIAGWAGAIGVTAAVIVPSTILTFLIARYSANAADSRFYRALRDGFAPISVGLMSGTGWLFMQVSNESWRADVLTVLSVLLVVKTKINPVFLILVGAIAGMAQWV